jgi:hypothetical protein
MMREEFVCAEGDMSRPGKVPRLTEETRDMIMRLPPRPDERPYIRGSHTGPAGVSTEGRPYSLHGTHCIPKS